MFLSQLKWTMTDSVPELPVEVWDLVIEFMCKSHGVCACKHLRAYARVSRLFYWHTFNHPDYHPAGHMGYSVVIVDSDD